MNREVHSYIKPPCFIINKLDITGRKNFDEDEKDYIYIDIPFSDTFYFYYN